MSFDEKQVCLNCVAWKPTRRPESQDMWPMAVGECRFDPPVAYQFEDGSIEAVWPPTRGKDWCLKFKERPSDV
jgi:hypothetical protein